VSRIQRGDRVRLPDGRTGTVTVISDRAGRRSEGALGRLDPGQPSYPGEGGAFSVDLIDLTPLDRKAA
jgi:hypothetical protein